MKSALKYLSYTLNELMTINLSVEVLYRATDLHFT